MYDQPILGGYEQALQLSGSPKAPVYTFSPTHGRRAGVPERRLDAGTLAHAVAVGRRPERSQVGAHLAEQRPDGARVPARPHGVGQLHVREGQPAAGGHRREPDQPDRHAGRRPRRSTARRSTRRRALDPRFNHINEVQSIGDSTFKSLTLQVTKRFAQGLTFNVQYPLGKGTDNTPLLDAVDGAVGSRAVPIRATSTATSGPNPLDMRHNFTGNIVYTTSSHVDEHGRPRAAERQRDRRAAAVQQRPAGEHPVQPRPQRRRRQQRPPAQRRPRNSLYLPARKNVDMRYTRWIPIHGSIRGEIIMELKNVFNTEQMSGIYDDDGGRHGRQPDRRRFRPTRTSS